MLKMLIWRVSVYVNLRKPRAGRGYPQMETLRWGLIPLPSTSGVSLRGVLGVKWGLLSALCP